MKTGISAEEMSQLKHAADLTGTSYDMLVRGLTLFEAATVKAGEGSQQQAQAFQRLGITQAQLAAGERDIVPLLGERDGPDAGSWQAGRSGPRWRGICSAGAAAK